MYTTIRAQATYSGRERPELLFDEPADPSSAVEARGITP